jgi:membrane protein insertase Oxa1/YidC/SpoIIIJ
MRTVGSGINVLARSSQARVRRSAFSLDNRLTWMSAIRTELVLRSGRFAVVAKGLPQFVANFLKKLVSFQWGRSCSFATFSVRLTISWLNFAAATRSTG